MVADGGDGADGSVGGDGGGDAVATAVAVVCVGGSKLRSLTEPDGSGETLWPLPLPLLLSVSMEARLTEVSDGGDGGDRAGGSVSGDGGGDTLVTADASCLCRSNQTDGGADGWR